MLRSSNAETFEVLSALRLSALGYAQNVCFMPRKPQRTSDIGQKRARDKSIQQQSDRWLTTLEAAQLTGVHDRTIRRWIVAQRLPARRQGGR
jgi:excisionase family DNA binding protein